MSGTSLRRRLRGWPSLDHAASAILFAFGVVALLQAARLALIERGDAVQLQAIAGRELLEAGAALTSAIEAAVAPAMATTRRAAKDPAVLAAVASGAADRAIAACNAIVLGSRDIDAITLFDADGHILGINSVYADGTAVDPERMHRVLVRDFTDRPIIGWCLRNTAHEELLEFQTGCDITPAYFDSSGLSVAHSVPMFDASERQIGVASSRLRFERIADLGKLHTIADGLGKAEFVTDSGRIFDELINSGRSRPDIAPAELGAIVAPIAAGRGLHSFVELGDRYIGLQRMRQLHTIDGGGIQVLLTIPETWVAGRCRTQLLADALSPGALGLLSIVLGFLLLTHRRLCRARLAAETASHTKSEFLANMSHEIRTPMSAILGYAELLQVDGPDDAAHRSECIETIRRNGEHLLALINDILDISKIEAGKLQIETVPTRLDALLREVLATMAVKAQAKGIVLEAEAVTPIPAGVASDPCRVRQILVNLIGNAIKFTEAGRVSVRIACPGPSRKRLEFEVADTGIGMTAAQQATLFQAFSQADASTTRRFGGTGLGLHISRRLAIMLGGDIRVTSVAGEGSKFTAVIHAEALDDQWLEPGALVLDLVVPSRPRGERSRPAKALSGVRVLLAEDGPDNVRLISHVLRKAGADVQVATNGALAVKALTVDGTLQGALQSPAPFDLVLTDIQMPEMDGYEVAGLLRQKGCRLPIMALTAHAMAGDRERCLAAGCTSYASKPIDRQRLIDGCVEALAPARAMSE